MKTLKIRIWVLSVIESLPRESVQKLWRSTSGSLPHTSALLIKNSKGQSMVEYLILVALMGVASIGIIRALNQTLNSQLADVVFALQGRQKKAATEQVDESLYKKKDLSDFMNGAAARRKSE